MGIGGSGEKWRVILGSRMAVIAEKYVCAECVGDVYLKDIIRENAVRKECSYCGNKSEPGGKDIAVSVEVVLGPIDSGFDFRFVNVGACGPDEKFWRTREALAEIFKCHYKFFCDVAKLFPERWWAPKTFNDGDEEFRSSWEWFANLVKFRSRFFFLGKKSPLTLNSSHSPQEFFEKIRSIVLSKGMIKPIEAGSSLFRARYWQDYDEWPSRENIGKELAAPPVEKTLAQRMNPSGISYFYVAKERETALAEVVKKPPCRVIVGEFKVACELSVIDLRSPLKNASVFSDEDRKEWATISFLDFFAKEISKPVSKDGMEHLEYVPTQVVAEYFAKEFQTNEGQFVDGIVYPSAVWPNGANVVLFRQPDSKNLILHDPKCLQFGNWPEFFEVVS